MSISHIMNITSFCPPLSEAAALIDREESEAQTQQKNG